MCYGDRKSESGPDVKSKQLAFKRTLERLEGRVKTWGSSWKCEVGVGPNSEDMCTPCQLLRAASGRGAGCEVAVLAPAIRYLLPIWEP